MHKLSKTILGKLIIGRWTKLKKDYEDLRRGFLKDFYKQEVKKLYVHRSKKVDWFQPKAVKEMPPHMTLTAREICAVLGQLKKFICGTENTCLLRLSYA